MKLTEIYLREILLKEVFSNLKEILQSDETAKILDGITDVKSAGAAVEKLTQAAAKLGISISSLKNIGDTLALEMIPSTNDEQEDKKDEEPKN